VRERKSAWVREKEKQREREREREREKESVCAREKHAHARTLAQILALRGHVLYRLQHTLVFLVMVIHMCDMTHSYV